MKTRLDRIAAILAFVIGVMALFAGGKALIGKLPNWSVLSWLPFYNYTMGLLIVLFAAPFLWKAGRYSLGMALSMLSINAAVLALLKTAFAARVAPESLQAMTQRVLVWLVIVVLTLVASRLAKPASQPASPEAGYILK